MKVLSSMRSFSVALVLASAVGAMVMSTTASAAAPATAPGQNKPICFDGTSDGGFGGVCTLSTSGAKGVATLQETDSNPAGDYAGVYLANSTMSGALLGDITQLSYSYTGNVSPTPGRLSLNIPLDENGDGTTEQYAFIDAFYCPGVNGDVNVIKDSNCTIYVGGVTPYANWAALVAANPTWKVATDNVSFVIAERTPNDVPQTWTVSHLTLGKGGK